MKLEKATLPPVPQDHLGPALVRGPLCNRSRASGREMEQAEDAELGHGSQHNTPSLPPCGCPWDSRWGYWPSPFISYSGERYRGARYFQQPALLCNVPTDLRPLPPSSTAWAPRHTWALGGSRQGNLSFHARLVAAWLGRCSSSLIYSQAPRPHTLQYVPPACLPLGLFNPRLYLSPEAVGIMARPEIALETFT